MFLWGRNWVVTNWKKSRENQLRSHLGIWLKLKLVMPWNPCFSEMFSLFLICSWNTEIITQCLGKFWRTSVSRSESVAVKMNSHHVFCSFFENTFPAWGPKAGVGSNLPLCANINLNAAWFYSGHQELQNENNSLYTPLKDSNSFEFASLWLIKGKRWSFHR